MKKKELKNEYFSQEAYFSKENSSIAIALRTAIEQIHEVYVAINGEKRNFKDIATIYQKKIETIVKKLEKDIEIACNLEKCYVGLVDISNAWAIPCCWDANLIDVKHMKEKKILTWNDTFEKDLYNIIDSKNGYKFKNKKGKVFIICIGLGLFDEMSVEEITAIMLHEIGHSFQHMIYDIGENIFNRKRVGLLSLLSMFDKFLKSKGGNNFIVEYILFILNILRMAAIAGTINRIDKLADKHGKGIVGKYLLLDEVGYYMGKGYDKNVILGRNETGKEVVKTNSLGINRFILRQTKKNDKSFGAMIGKGFAAVGKFFFTTIVSLIFNFIVFPITYPMTNFHNALFIFSSKRNRKFLRRNKVAEEFADYFATANGYGPELATALIKFRRLNEHLDFEHMNFLYAIPGLNLWNSLQQQKHQRNMSLLNGYPLMRERVAGVYKVLQYELENNKTLTAQQKAEIRAQMEQTNQEFEKYIFNSHIANLPFLICAKIRGMNIKNIDTSIEENVMDALYGIAEDLEAKTNDKQKAELEQGLKEGLGRVFTDKMYRKLMDVTSTIGLSDKGVENISYADMLGYEFYINDTNINDITSGESLYGEFDLDRIEINPYTCKNEVYLKKKLTKGQEAFKDINLVETISYVIEKAFIKLASPHAKLESMNRELFYNSVKKIREEENKKILKHIQVKILKKYFRLMKTKYGLKTTPAEVTAMFNFIKLPKSDAELEVISNRGFIPLFQIKLPKNDKNAISSLYLMKNIQDKNDMFSSKFWFHTIHEIHEKDKNNKYRHNLDYYFKIMLIMDLISELRDTDEHNISLYVDKKNILKHYTKLTTNVPIYEAFNPGALEFIKTSNLYFGIGGIGSFELKN